MTDSPRYFTIEEATAALPEVERLLRRLRDLRTALSAAKGRLDALWDDLHAGTAVLDELLAAQRDLEARAEAVAGAMSHLAEIGCLLRDLDLGLVDFPAVTPGGEVYLCWHLGEDAIRFWHGPTEGYAGRKPLTRLPGGPRH